MSISIRLAQSDGLTAGAPAGLAKLGTPLKMIGGLIIFIGIAWGFFVIIEPGEIGVKKLFGNLTVHVNCLKS